MILSAFVFEKFPELETENLRLRCIFPSDIEAWVTVFNHPDVMRFLIDFNQTWTDADEVKDIIQWTEDIFARQTGLRWAITRKPDNRMIGSCGFHLYSATHRCAEIGYELHHEYWRQGIMKETLTAVLNFGFQQLNLHRIEANVTAGNEASAGLLMRLGFKMEGISRDKVYARGQFYHLWLLGLLEHEYRLITAD